MTFYPFPHLKTASYACGIPKCLKAGLALKNILALPFILRKLNRSLQLSELVVPPCRHLHLFIVNTCIFKSLLGKKNYLWPTEEGAIFPPFWHKVLWGLFFHLSPLNISPNVIISAAAFLSPFSNFFEGDGGGARSAGWSRTTQFDQGIKG